jgi:putative hydrolase of the HAD superfamily
MTRAVIFDLGQVLVPFDFLRGYNLLQPLCGYPIPEIRRRIGATGLVPRLESGQIAPRDFVARIGDALGIQLEYDRFCAIWGAIFIPGTLVPDSWIAGIKKKYPLVLLSNTNAIHFEMLEKDYPILRHFDSRILSHEVGVMKPSPVIYRKAVEAAGCRAEECFFTDDVPEYVEGARNCGLDAVQFLSANQLRAELAARNITWDESPASGSSPA